MTKTTASNPQGALPLVLVASPAPAPRPAPAGQRPWVLDDQTRELGRRGLANARATLRAARARALDRAAAAADAA